MVHVWSIEGYFNVIVPFVILTLDGFSLFNCIVSTCEFHHNIEFLGDLRVADVRSLPADNQRHFTARGRLWCTHFMLPNFHVFCFIGWLFSFVNISFTCWNTRYPRKYSAFPSMLTYSCCIWNILVAKSLFWQIWRDILSFRFFYGKIIWLNISGKTVFLTFSSETSLARSFHSASFPPKRCLNHINIGILFCCA